MSDKNPDSDSKPTSSAKRVAVGNVRPGDAVTGVPVIGAMLLVLLNHEDSNVRKGAYEGVMKHLQKTTKLSKSEVRDVCRRFVPVQTVQAATPPANAVSKMEKKELKALKKEGPLAKQVREDIDTYPLDNRGPNTDYANAIREARSADRAKKA